MTEALSEGHQLVVDHMRRYANGWWNQASADVGTLIGIIDLLVAEVERRRQEYDCQCHVHKGERVPEGWRVERVWAIDPDRPNHWINNPVLIAVDPDELDA